MSQSYREALPKPPKLLDFGMLLNYHDKLPVWPNPLKFGMLLIYLEGLPPLPKLWEFCMLPNYRETLLVPPQGNDCHSERRQKLKDRKWNRLSSAPIEDYSASASRRFRNPKKLTRSHACFVAAFWKDTQKNLSLVENWATNGKPHLKFPTSIYSYWPT